MRVRQKHVITVVMDTTYDIHFGQLDARRGWSTSRSTQIDEIDNAEMKNERVLSQADQHGFLWRLNTYWRWKQVGTQTYAECQVISLSRKPVFGSTSHVKARARDSLRSTLTATARAAKTLGHK